MTLSLVVRHTTPWALQYSAFLLVVAAGLASRSVRAVWRHLPPLRLVRMQVLWIPLPVVAGLLAVGVSSGLVGGSLLDGLRAWVDQWETHPWLWAGLGLCALAAWCVWVPWTAFISGRYWFLARVLRVMSHASSRGDAATVRRVVAPLLEPVGVAPVDALSRSMALGFEAQALLSDVRHNDDRTSLDLGLALTRESLNLAANRSVRLIGEWLALSARDDLADSLWYRYQDAHSLDALDEVIRIRRSLPNWPWPIWLLENRQDLAEALGARYQERGDPADAREALAHARRAARHPSRSKRRRAARLLVLGNQYLHVHDADPEDATALDAAMTAYRKGAALHDGLMGRHCRSGLVRALLLRAEARGESDGDRAAAEDRAEAVQLARRLAADAEPESSERAERDLMLALALRGQFLAPGGGKAEAEEAVLSFRSAAHNTWGFPRIRLNAAYTLAYFQVVIAASAAQEESLASAEVRLALWSDAADAFDLAVSLQPLAAWRGIAHPDQRRILSEWSELAVDAAAACIRAARPERAVELLEQGRTVMWSQILELRSGELAGLRATDPELFEDLDEIRRELDAPPASAHGERSAAEEERRTALARAWDELVRDHGLLRVPVYADLRAAAADGPVVIVNISLLGCHALVVTDADVPLVIPLDEVDHPGLQQELDRLAQADARVASARADLYEARTAEERERAGTAVVHAEIRRSRAVLRMLDRLWEGIARPVLDALPELAGTEGGLPRLWWCPTGLATYLPLHAAGARDGAPGQSVSERVVPSYAPTLKSLIHARRPRTEDEQAVSELLLVTVPEPDLPEVEREAEVVTGRVPGTRRLHGADATVDAVARLLPRHRHLHAACHGVAREGLRLYGGAYLSPLRLSRIPATSAEFAFLSACETATPDPEVLDEAVHPAAVLYFGGFRQVVASLYPVQDATAALVADSVYAGMTEEDGLRPARAARSLHAALAELRRAHPALPGRWVPYIHVGG
ncbi:CHAT domain-containing protein [Streptomyces sp. NPDC050548]|uniref:CHAT domain-containing protein n=1 Tax=Streptomyces sp. NPDC050548 TaxID=3365629 RepID=UPI0037B1B86D